MKIAIDLKRNAILNNKFKYKLITLIIASSFFGGMSNASHAANQLVTLQEMVEDVITENPEVQSRYHRFLESKLQQDVLIGEFLPKADIVSRYRKQEKLANTADGTNTPRWNNELVLRQMIFDGFYTSNEVKKLDHASRVRYYELQSAIQNVTLEFIGAYTDSIRYRELLQLAKENYVTHKQLFDRMQEAVNKGLATKADLDQAAGRLALAESSLLTEETNLHNAATRMQRLHGEIPTSRLATPTFFNSGIEQNPVAALKIAYNQNPELLSAIEGIQASKNEIETKEARYYPKLDLQARKNISVSNDGRFNPSAADSIELTMNFNLFNGFSDENSVAQSAEKLNSARDLRDKACVDTRQAVVLAYNDIQQLKKQEKYRTSHKNSIENARESYRKQFDSGHRTLLDLLNSENEVFEAKRALANNQYDIQMAYARAYAGQGELLNKIGVERDDLPGYGNESYMYQENVCEAASPVQEITNKTALIAAPKTSNTIASSPTPAAKPLAKKIIQGVEFETNSAKIKTISYPSLNNAINTLKEWGNSNVEIAGHTDKTNISKADYNQLLSEQRAQAVLNYLVENGIDAKRLSAKGYGFSQPISNNDPIKGSAANRRVELIPR